MSGMGRVDSQEMMALAVHFESRHLDFFDAAKVIACYFQMMVLTKVGVDMRDPASFAKLAERNQRDAAMDELYKLYCAMRSDLAETLERLPRLEAHLESLGLHPGMSLEQATAVLQQDLVEQGILDKEVENDELVR